MLELRNTYYAALPAPIQKELKRSLVLKEFDAGDPLPIDTGGVLYLPITCVAVICIRANGYPGTFLRFSGHSSFVGIARVLNGSKVKFEAVTCCGGYALVMPAKVLTQYLDDKKLSAEWNARYLSLFLEEVSVSVYCAQSHDSSQRVARLLLEAFDSLPGGSEVAMTHSKLADLVGVRRETVSLDLVKWARMGIISTKKGSIKIVQRDRLYEIACECYRHSSEARFSALELWKAIPWKVG
jgi:hypothetical protein